MWRAICLLLALAVVGCGTTGFDTQSARGDEEPEWHPCEQDARQTPTHFKIAKVAIPDIFYCAYRKEEPVRFFGEKIGNIKSGYGSAIAEVQKGRDYQASTRTILGSIIQTFEEQLKKKRLRVKQENTNVWLQINNSLVKVNAVVIRVKDKTGLLKKTVAAFSVLQFEAYGKRYVLMLYVQDVPLSAEDIRTKFQELVNGAPIETFVATN